MSYGADVINISTVSVTSLLLRVQLIIERVQSVTNIQFKL